jgi:hypothetical protein
MEIKDLVRLSAKADSEGNFRVADRITEKIETMSREAFWTPKPGFVQNLARQFGFGNKSGQNAINIGEGFLENIEAPTSVPKPKPGGVPRRTQPKPKPNQEPLDAATDKPPVVDSTKPPIVDPTKPPIVDAPGSAAAKSRSLTMRDMNQSNTDNSRNYGGLIAAALGAYGMYLMAGKIYDPTGKIVSPDKLPENIKQMFNANQLSMRSQAGQMGN